LKKISEQSGPLDGIFLVLHGAMCCTSVPDVEGELLERIRKIPALATIPLGGVLDLHANFSARMAQNSNGLIAYRENPHSDARETAVAAAELLDKLMQSGRRPVTVWDRPPLIWTPQGTATASDPMRALEAAAREIERSCTGVLAVNVLAGFAYADTPDTGVSFSAVTEGDASVAQQALKRLSALAIEMKSLGLPEVLSPDACMAKVKAHAKGPVVIAEPSDNIGGGAPGDGTGLLRALISHDVQNSAVAICDPLAVSQAAARGLGGTLTLQIGGRGSRLDPGPLTLEVQVVGLSDGRFELEDRHSHLASMSGARVDMGASAVVRFKDICILLNSRPTPPFDLGQFRSQGIVPEKLFAVGVKAAAAHRRAYDPIAAAHYSIETPGPCASDLRTLPFRLVRRPVFTLDD
jgi:microcystin degradation protein MlrC